MPTPTPESPFAHVKTGDPIGLCRSGSNISYAVVRVLNRDNRHNGTIYLDAGRFDLRGEERGRHTYLSAHYSLVPVEVARAKIRASKEANRRTSLEALKTAIRAHQTKYPHDGRALDLVCAALTALGNTAYFIDPPSNDSPATDPTPTLTT